MKKNFLIGFPLVLVLLQLGYTASRGIKNPGLMHMHRREFIAVGLAQGFAARGDAAITTPEVFASRVIQYTDALMKALNTNEKEED